MKTSLSALFLLVVPSLAGAQDQAPVDLAAVETARSRACVPALADLAALNRDLEPLSRRAVRLQALDQAIALEDSSTVAPFDPDDPVETAVQAWFGEDAALGARWAETQDSSVLDTRRETRAAVRTLLREELQQLTIQGRTRVQEAGDVQGAALPCVGAILVRPVVLEVCAGRDTDLCRAAADTAQGRYRFVAAAEDIWDVEELRPWSDPGPLGFAQDGTLGGARTAAQARRGNIKVGVALSPMIRERAAVAPEQAAEFDANLDSLGFTFEHPGFVMAPAFEVQLGVAGPIGGETHYMVHFGDLSDPANQLIWSVAATGEGPIQAAFPAAPGALARLQQGEMLNVTAVAMGPETEDGQEAEAVYTVPVTGVNQARAVTAVLNYMASGQLGQDLARLVPPTTGG